MSYDLVWDVEAFRKLERIWYETTPLEPVASAFDELERRLILSPDEEGESRVRGRRILIVPPLGAIYRVQERMKEVHVLDVWTFHERKR